MSAIEAPRATSGPDSHLLPSRPSDGGDGNGPDARRGRLAALGRDGESIAVRQERCRLRGGSLRAGSMLGTGVQLGAAFHARRGWAGPVPEGVQSSQRELGGSPSCAFVWRARGVECGWALPAAHATRSGSVIGFPPCLITLRRHRWPRRASRRGPRRMRACKGWRRRACPCRCRSNWADARRRRRAPSWRCLRCRPSGAAGPGASGTAEHRRRSLGGGEAAQPQAGPATTMILAALTTTGATTPAPSQGPAPVVRGLCSRTLAGWWQVAAAPGAAPQRSSLGGEAGRCRGPGPLAGPPAWDQIPSRRASNSVRTSGSTGRLPSTSPRAAWG